MKRFWNYLNHSNLKLAIDCNPFVWSFRFMYQGPDPNSDPHLHIWYIRFLPLSIILTIDDGSYILVGDNLEISEETTEDDLR